MLPNFELRVLRKPGLICHEGSCQETYEDRLQYRVKYDIGNPIEGPLWDKWYDVPVEEEEGEEEEE